jgi:hypothetical protein
MTPPEGHLGQHAYTFVIRILSTSLTCVSIFSVCCYSKYLQSIYISHSQKNCVNSELGLSQR